jgi:tRNA threonylcarbamoyladenosine biosynthesis protein TsaB
MILGLDTATPSTAAAVWAPDGPAFEARDDPEFDPTHPRPRHASRLLELVEAALDGAGASWDEIERIAVGVGPGGFTGLRIGMATARALAQARGLPLVPVSSLAALAEGAGDAGAEGAGGAGDAGAGDAAGARLVAAVIDARRGEVFAAAWQLGRSAAGAPVFPPQALAPQTLAQRLRALEAPVQAVGDGAVRFRAELEAAGVAVPADGSAAHRIAAAPLCRLGAAGEPAERDGLLPDYRREPDAKPQQ